MATFYGSWVATDDFRAILDATVSNTSATQCTVKLVVKIQSNYAYASSSGRASVTCNGTTHSDSVAYSAGKTTTLMTKSFTVARGSSSKQISVSGKVWQLNASSAYATGSTASGKVTIPAIDYDEPNAPSSCAASRVSDTSAKVTWTNGSTTTLKPRSSVKVERQTDGGSWSQIASVGASTANYTDNSISANHRYAYRVRSYGAGGYSGYSTSGYIYTTPAAPSSVSITKTSGTQVSLSVGTSSAPYATSWEVQESLNGGDWTAVGSFTTFPQTVDVGGGTAKLRVRAVRDSLASAWVESNTVTTIVAPNAPTITNKPASVVPVGDMLFVQWTPNHPDGTEQTAAQVGWTFGDEAEQVVDIYGDDTTSTYLSTEPCAVKVRVRTKGLAADWGAWSSYYSFTVAVPPEAHFTAPGIDGAKIGDLPLTVAWKVVDDTGVAAQTLQLTDEAGRVLHTANPATGAREYELGASTYQLANATAYRLVLTVRGGSSLTVTTTRDFATSFAEPSRPSADVELDESAMSQAVTVHAGPSTSDTGEVIEVSATPGTLVPGFEVYGRTRQNLWVNPSGTVSGVTVTNNDDGTISITGEVDSRTPVVGKNTYSLVPGKTYTLICDKALGTSSNSGFYIQNRIGAGYGSAMFTGTGTSLTYKVPEGSTSYVCGVTVDYGFSQGTYRVMLREATEDEIAAAQQTASTLQEGGTADLPQDHPVTLPADPSVYATGDDFDWCPPGINGVEPEAIVTAGKNLWQNPAGTVHGMTFTSNDDGSLMIEGTSDAPFSIRSDKLQHFVAGETYTLSIDKRTDSRLIIEVLLKNESDTTIASIIVGNSDYNDYMSNTFTVPDDGSYSYFQCDAYVRQAGLTVSDTFRVMVNVGETSGSWEPPAAVTSTPIDMQGHALYGVGDARDVLHVDGTGAASIEQSCISIVFDGSEDWLVDSGSGNKRYRLQGSWGIVGPASNGSYPPMLCDSYPLQTPDNTYLGKLGCTFSTGGSAFYVCDGTVNDLAGFKQRLAAKPMVVVAQLKDQKTVDLGNVTMPEFPADPTTVWAVSDIPGEVAVAYPDTDSLSVTRVLEDGSRWLVADGLADGEQAIDPLPPLNVPYSYIVTARTEAGAEVQVEIETQADSRGRAALNFDQAASVALITQYDFSMNDGYEHGGSLLHFATDDGLPLFYATADVDMSGSYKFTLLGKEAIADARESFRRYSVGWLRTPDGRRMRAMMSAKFSTDNRFPKASVSLNADEVQWGEA